MQEINLLQTKFKDTTLAWQKRTRILTLVLTIVLALILAGIVLITLINRQTSKRLETLKTQNVQEQNNLNRRQNELTLAKSFQAQLHNLSYLTSNHVYWSAFFDELSKFTYIKAQYVSVDGDLSGKIHLEGIVGSYSDLGKLMLALNTSDKFDDVRLLSASPSSSEQAGYLFSIDLQVNKELFAKL